MASSQEQAEQARRAREQAELREANKAAILRRQQMIERTKQINQKNK